MKRRHRVMRVGALAALLACGACQSYRPLELASVRRGARVRVVVDRPVPIRLREITIDQAQLVDAEAVGVDNDNLVLSALWVERSGGGGTPGEGWTVTVPVGSVSKLTERRFSWLRTALVGTALVVGTSLGWRVFGVGASGGINGNGSGQQL